LGIDETKSNLPLGLKDNGFGHAGHCPSWHILGPGFREIEAERDGNATPTGCHGQAHSALAVGSFAEGPAILMRNANRMGSLFGEPRVINDPGFDGSLEFHGLASIIPGHAENRFIRPTCLGYQVMQGLVPRLYMNRVQPGRHGLNAFPVPWQDQPLAIQSQGLPAIGMTSGLCQQTDIGIETRSAFDRLDHKQPHLRT
jgi:hypothetical protein